MIPAQVISFEREVDDLIALGGQQKDDEVRNAFAKLVCVRISGYVEFSVRAFMSQLAEKKTNRTLQTFVQWNINQFMNPRPDKISDFLSHFNAQYRIELDQIFQNRDDLKEALAAVVGLRNKIAHGGSGSTDLSHCKNYWLLVKDLVVEIKKILEKTRRSA